MKIKFYLSIVSVTFIQLTSLHGWPTVAQMDDYDKVSAAEYQHIIVNNKLPIGREQIPPSLKERISKNPKLLKQQKDSDVSCNENTLCASFDSNTTPENVSSWMGFNYTNKTGSYFIATYGQEATHLGNNVYSTAKWDKHHFWMHIGKDIPPFPIQPRFVGIDKESANEWYTVDYVGYRLANENIDYSNYWENMSQSALVFLIDPKTKEVKEYYLEYYDENDEYVGDYDIEVGDEIESYFVAFRKGQEDREYFFSLEDITSITSQISFSYEELYPGKDFNVTYGKDLNFSKFEFKYIFESYGKIRSNFTEPKSIETKETNNSTVNNLSSSSSKSVPISGFWMFFILSMLIAVVALKNDNRLHKV